MSIDLRLGDCLEVLRAMPDASVHAIVTDPPYGLAFMGKRWDYDVPSVEVWAECLRVLKPGGHLLAFAGTRTQHRMACRIEDAGFEIRDLIAWVYGSGFPKSLDVSKAIDKMDAADVRTKRQMKFCEWMRGTDLNRAHATEVLRAAGVISENGTMAGHFFAASVDGQPAVATRELFEVMRPHFGCDVPEWVEQLVDERSVESENFKRREVVGRKRTGDPVSWYAESARRDGVVDITAPATDAARQWSGWGTALKPAMEPITMARKPLSGTVAANVLEHGTGAINVNSCRVEGDRWPSNLLHDGSHEPVSLLSDASRFFYTAKATRAEREGVTHPTVKPLDLMAYLCRLVTPPGGIVLDPFMGSGTTIKAAISEGFSAIGIERDPAYFAMAEHRMKQAQIGLTFAEEP